MALTLAECQAQFSGKSGTQFFCFDDERCAARSEGTLDATFEEPPPMRSFKGYEGTEKTLEITFVRERGRNLHRVERRDWDAILSEARCQILSEVRNEEVVAFVLSESSLFIYEWELHLKTCGSSTLLRCLPKLLETTCREGGMTLENVRFSRKNYSFPDDQQFPHLSFASETTYGLNAIRPYSKTRGGAYVLGDLMADHWNVFFVSNARGGSSREGFETGSETATMTTTLGDRTPMMQSSKQNETKNGTNNDDGRVITRGEVTEEDSNDDDDDVAGRRRPPSRQIAFEEEDDEEEEEEDSASRSDGTSTSGSLSFPPSSCSPASVVVARGEKTVSPCCDGGSEDEKRPRVINVMMYGLDEVAADVFVRREGEDERTGSRRATRESGIERLFSVLRYEEGRAREVDDDDENEGDGEARRAKKEPAVLDSWLFSPCGYSLNALLEDGYSYATIHVTPERGFSYASFETNLDARAVDTREVLVKVLEVFRPRKFTATVFCDRPTLASLLSARSDVLEVGDHHHQYARVGSCESACVQNGSFFAEVSNFVMVSAPGVKEECSGAREALLVDAEVGRGEEIRCGSDR